MDAHKNFAYSTVATAPSPATSGTSLVVAAAGGALFPAVPFNAVVWPTGVQPLASNAEVVRVTNISTDTFTITRTQESSSARTVVVGDQISANVTNKTLTDIEAGVVMVRLDEVVLSGSQATIDFSGISGSYRKLEIEFHLRTDRAAVADTTVLRVNADSSAVYSYQTVTAANTSVAGNEVSSATSAQFGHVPGASGTANRFGTGTLEFPYYAGSAHKTFLSRAFDNYSAADVLVLAGGIWPSTSAITQVTLLPGVGTNFVTGSRAALYGIT